MDDAERAQKRAEIQQRMRAWCEDIDAQTRRPGEEPIARVMARQLRRPDM